MITKVIRIECDECHESAVYVVAATVKEARKEAEKLGWVHTNKDDYCPHCDEVMLKAQGKPVHMPIEVKTFKMTLPKRPDHDTP